MAILISCLYLVLFILLIYVTLNEKLFKYRFIFKLVTSFCFVIIYLVTFKKFDFFMFLALILCVCGDGFLAYIKDGKKVFMVYGMASFLLAHIMYINVMLSHSRFVLVDSFISIIALVALKLLTLKLDMYFGAKRYIIWLYTFIIFLMVTKAIDVLVLKQDMFSLLFGIGACLFVISDIILMLLYFKFKDNKTLQITNSVVYYLAQYLMAISFMFVVK